MKWNLLKATQEDKLERTTSAMLKITVLGNGSAEELKFSKSTYIVELMENVPLGSRVLQTSVTPQIAVRDKFTVCKKKT